MKTANLSDSDLREYFGEHVRYEIQMLLNTAGAILRKLQVPMGLQHAPVESYGIHLRNLITFFYPALNRDTDVYAGDFFIDKNDWNKIKPTQNSVLQVAKIRADKELGHLTTARIGLTEAQKTWDVKILTDEIMKVVEVFYKTANKIELESLMGDIFHNYSIVKNL